MTTPFRTLLTALLLVLAIGTAAAQDVVPVKTAVELFAAGTARAKTVLPQQGYTYRGITGYETKSHTWTKRVQLSNDFVPTNFEKGTSSIVSIDSKDGTLCVYVFNRNAFETLKSEARKLGYESDKKGDFFFKDDAPNLLFLELGKPFTYLMQVTE